MRLARGLRLPGDRDDGAARPVLAQQVGGLAARRDDHDGGRQALRGSFHCRDSRGVRWLNWGPHLQFEEILVRFCVQNAKSSMIFTIIKLNKKRENDLYFYNVLIQ